MADIGPVRSNDGSDNTAYLKEEDGGQRSPSSPVRTPSSRSEDSQPAKIPLCKDTSNPEVHGTAPPANLAVRTSRYDNTYDITYDDITLSDASKGQHRLFTTGIPPPDPADPTLRTPTPVYTPHITHGPGLSTVPGVPHIGLTDRDPTHMNDDVKVEFEDLFAEPDGARSLDYVWTSSALVFTNTKFWCYRILTTIFAIPCAFCWGISFACLTCGFVWNVRPMMRRYAIEIIPYARIWRIFIDACISPIFESCGRVFSGIIITLKKD